MASTHEWQSIGGEIMDSRALIAVADSIRGMDDAERGENEEETLAAIAELEAAGIEDWAYGAVFIREDYFEQYAEQVAEDIGAIDPDAGWPLGHINWSAAADALKMDYQEVEFQGSTYYVR